MPALLRIVASFLVGLLIEKGGNILARAFTFFGVAWVTQKYALPEFLSYLQGALSGAPQIAVTALAGVNFDKAITIILSAYIARAAGNVVLRKKAS